MKAAKKTFVNYGKDEVSALKSVYKANGDASKAMCELEKAMAVVYENNLSSIIVAEKNLGSIIVAMTKSIIVASSNPSSIIVANGAP